MIRRLFALPVFVAALVLGVSGRAVGTEGGFCESIAATSIGDGIVYSKSENQLCLIRHGRAVLEVGASHGRGDGPKQCEGDHRTPEGDYQVRPARNSRQFGRFMAISYPNASDESRARQLACEPGSAIGIHGPQDWYAFLGEAQAFVNHSDGCIVLDRDGMQRLDAGVTRRTRILILP